MDKTQLDGLANQGQHIDDFLTDSIQWCKNGVNIDHPEPTLLTLKSHRREVRRVLPNINSKPTLCLFGASQAGKSNLAKNLLYDEKENACLVYDPKRDKKLNYNRYINPDGNGQEATAVLTRFVKFDPVDSEFPLTLRLLSASDVITCICSGFFTMGELKAADIEYDTMVQNALAAAKTNSKTRTGILTEDDIYSIKEYFESHPENNFNEFFRSLKDNDFWARVSKHCEYLSPVDIVEVFSIFWYNNPLLKSLFGDLMTVLESLNFSKEINADYDVILKQLPEGYESEFTGVSNILDVTTLYSLNKNSHRFNILDKSQKQVSVLADKLCILCREVVLPIKSEDDIITEYDILDFPGARKEVLVDVNGDMDDKVLALMFLRGKVKYLFNSYSDNYMINNLVIASCMTEQKDGATSIPPLLRGWVEKYIGKSQEARAQTLSKYHVPPVFIVLTFWNKVLTKTKAADVDSPESKINDAFGRRFIEDLFANYDWHDKWAHKRFQNFYMLRDFEYCKLYSAENETEPLNAYETLDASKKNYFDKAATLFQTSEAVTRHFASAKLSFDKASTPKNDGAEYIIENIRKNDAMKLKTVKYTEILKNRFNKAITLMDAFKYDEDKSAQIMEAVKISKDISDRLSTMPSYGESSFSKFQEKFYLTENEVFNKVHAEFHSRGLEREADFNEYMRFIGNQKGLSSGMKKDDIREVLKRNLFKDNDQELLSYLGELKLEFDTLCDYLNSGLKKKSTLLVEKIYDYWTSEKLDKISASDFPGTPLNDVVITKISNTLKNSFNKLNLIGTISARVEDFIDNNINVRAEAYSMIADIITGHINKFVSTVGWAFVSDEEKSLLVKMSQESGLDVYEFTYAPVEAVKITKDELREVIDFLENYQERFNTNNGLDSDAIRRSPVLHNLYKWQDYIKLSKLNNIGSIDYDIEANNSLVQLLNESEDIFNQVA